MKNLLLTPLGFPSYAGQHTNVESAFLKAFARGDIRLAEKLLAEGGVRRELHLEYFYATGYLDVCEVMLAPALPQIGAGSFNLLARPRSFVTSLQPLRVLEFYAFCRRVENRWLAVAEQHRDGLLQNLELGAENIDRCTDRENWTRSPSDGVVKVYRESAEANLCQAFWMGVRVMRSHIEPFSGLVPPGLLAEALFCAHELDLFEQVVRSFPGECSGYIVGLNPQSRQRNRVDAVRLSLQMLLDNEAPGALFDVLG